MTVVGRRRFGSGVDVTISARLRSGTPVDWYRWRRGLRRATPADVRRETASATANRPPRTRRVWLPAIGRSSTYENAHPSRSTGDARNPSTRSRRDLVSTLSLRSNARSDFTRISSKSLDSNSFDCAAKSARLTAAIESVRQDLARPSVALCKRRDVGPIATGPQTGAAAVAIGTFFPVLRHRTARGVLC